ncbi:MAG: DUF2490 domain-containing protein [Phycisphaerales bacterium]|nr:MAG: DUF2490 domain-containing protein [Phycisphaerales bacterium]
MSKPAKTGVCALVLLVCGFGVVRPCFAFDDGDFQLWVSGGTSVDLNDDFKATLAEELRYGGNAGRLYYHHTEVGLVYGGLADWLDLGFNYRQIFEEDSSGQWRPENRPHLNATVKGQVSGFSVSDRSRFEYRDRENKKDMWRYRNKVTVKFPAELTCLKLKPYVAEEVFVDLDDGDYNKNRLYAGFSFDLTKRAKGGIFYVWQASKSAGAWKDLHVLGAQLKIPH